jgi:hypothetical protein
VASFLYLIAVGYRGKKRGGSTQSIYDFFQRTNFSPASLASRVTSRLPSAPRFVNIRHWKDHFKNDLRSDQDHRLKIDLRSDQDHV